MTRREIEWRRPGSSDRDGEMMGTQCGFASADPGHAISEDAQETKLRPVTEVTDRAWG
jgi:hypothetical protein